MNHVSYSTTTSPLEMLFLLNQQQRKEQRQCHHQATTTTTPYPYQTAPAAATNNADAAAHRAAATAAAAAAQQAAAEEALLFQRVAALNQRGIVWLQHFQYCGDSRSSHRALMLFRAALECTRDLLDGRGAGNSETVRNLLLLEDSSNEEKMIFDSMCDFESQCPSIVENIFVRPFHLIPSLTSAYSSDPLTNVSISFALLMFNMGIAFHLQAIITASQNQEAIAGDTLPSRDACLKARMLYQKSLTVLERVGVVPPSSSTRSSCSFGVSSSSSLSFSGCAVTDLLHMALYNNMSHVSCSMNDYLAAKQYSHRLQSLCCYLQPRVTTLYPDEPQTQSVLLDCIQSLWLNVQEPYFLQIPTVASAA